MTPKEVLFAASIVFFLYYTLIYLEIFSRKEYRLDRLKAHIEDFGYLHLMFPWVGEELRRPKILHPRNVLVYFIVIIFFILFLRITDFNMWLVSLFFALSPITAFFVVLVSVMLTGIPVSAYRRLVIYLASKKILKYQPFVIGVTGSYGKSLTKSYVAHVLSKKYKVLETPRNTNTDIGIALFILKNLHAKNIIFVAEIGAYKKGEILQICGMIRPKAGIITSFGTQHAALFGSADKIIEAKSELATCLPEKEGVLFLPTDEKKKIPKNIQQIIKAKIMTYKKIINDPHLQAVQAAVIVASSLDMSYDVIQESLETLPKPENLKVKKHIQKGYEYISSPYSTNVQGFISHILHLKKLKKPKTIIVTPGIIELGPEKDKEYKKIIEKIPTNTSIFTTDPHFALLSADAGLATVHKNSQKKLFEALSQKLDQSCAILIEGRFRKEFIDTIT